MHLWRCRQGRRRTNGRRAAHGGADARLQAETAAMARGDVTERCYR